MRERWRNIALLALVAEIPFELKYTLFGLSNLQWTFVALFLLSVPDLIRNWRTLKSDRLILAAALFVILQWAAASYAPEFHANAFKAAARFSAGFALLAIVRVIGNRDAIWRCWSAGATAAAIYALAEYGGLGFPWLFRDQEYYIGQVQRLSATFEYPNTAAAYFAMSLPIVWWTLRRPVLKWFSAMLLWSALILTFSRGAFGGLVVATAAAALFSRTRGREWRKPILLLAAGAAAFAMVTSLNPYKAQPFVASGTVNLVAAEYQTPWNSLQQEPGADDEVHLKVRNTGILKWPSNGLGRVAFSFRCLDQETQAFVNTPRLVTNLPHDVAPGQVVEVSAQFQTPDRPGRYLIAIELFRGDFDWFSRIGVIPVLIDAEIKPSATRRTSTANLAKWYGLGDPAKDRLTAAIPRLDLWHAALRMALEHPFGIGPDNYRLQYGRYLGATKWDTHMYSNSLYLELLTGSGLLGLAAFGLVVLLIRWRADAACLALAVFLLHGLVDVFLMTTPIYFAFWILAGSE